MKNKRQIKMWLMIALTLLVSVFSVLTDLLDFGTDEQVFTWVYWLNLALTNVAAVMIIFLSNSARKDSQMLKNTRFTSLVDSLFSLFKEVNQHNLRTSFETYIQADNARAKREAYIAKIQRKIAHCEGKIDRLEGRYNMWRLWLKKDTVEKPTTLRLTYYRKRLEYWLKRLTNVDKDVKYAKVKYLRVTYQSVFGMSETRLRESRDMSFHAVEHNMGLLVKKMFLIFIFGFAASLGFVFNPIAWTVEFFYKMALRLFQIVMALYTGISDADKFVDGDMCDALMNRIAYAQGFKETLTTKQC